MTALGAAVGILILSSLMAVSQGLKSQIEQTTESFQIDLAVQSEGASSPFGSKISNADYQALADIEGIAGVSSLIIGPIKTPDNPYFLIVGIAPADPLTENVSILQGRMPSAGKRELALGRIAAEAAGNQVGDRLALSDGDEYAVAGIYTTGSKMLDNAAILDTTDAQRFLKRDGFVNLALIRLEQGVSVEDAAARIEARFPALSVTDSGDFVGQISLLRVVDASAWIISIIALISSCIVVTNTLVMALSERTKEIGILMAIGWSRSRIMRTIIWESLIICFVGGLVGNALGLGLLWGLQYAHSAGIWIWASVSGIPQIVLTTMGVSLVLGLLSSLYPALLSTRLLPVEALRHE